MPIMDQLSGAYVRWQQYRRRFASTGPEADYANQRAQMEAARNFAKAELANANNKDALRERLYHMIDYAIRRYDWYEDQRHRLLQIGLALLAASSALLIPSLKFVFGEPTHVATGILLTLVVIVAFITAITTIFQYKLGLAGNYPYRKVADIRSWYFRYNQPGGALPSFDDTQKQFADKVTNAVANFKRFIERWSTHAKDDLAFVVEDLEQVFILQTLQNYSAQNRTMMIETLIRGVFFFALFTLLAFVSYVLGG